MTKIVYFRAVREGYYFAFHPILIVENDPDQRHVRFPLDPGLGLIGDPLQLSYSETQRRYAESIVRTRLHQPMFRAKVLHAYTGACTVCDLKHTELLDAAHITPDAAEHGFAHVSNGLALCKIHHAAYDSLLMGIRRASSTSTMICSKRPTAPCSGMGCRICTVAPFGRL